MPRGVRAVAPVEETHKGSKKKSPEKTGRLKAKVAPVEEVVEAPKRRGRPAKVAEPEPVQEAPKRGRKAAAPVVEEAKPKSNRDEVTGYIIGSDNDICAKLVIDGAFDRREILDKLWDVLEKKKATQTKSGNPKNLSNILTQTVNKLGEMGYVIESHWGMVLPEETPKSGRGTKK